MESLRRSFKSHGSYRRSSSRTPSIDRDLEDQPILLDLQEESHPVIHPHPHPQPEPQPTSTPVVPPAAEVVVSVDGNATATGTGRSDLWNKPTGQDDGDFSFHNGQQQQEQQHTPHHQPHHHRRRDNSGAQGHRHHHHHRSRGDAPPPLPPGDDPPSRLISSFLDKQKAAGVEVSLDMDLEMEELKRPNSPLPTTSSPLSAASAGGSREIRVSFQEPADGRILTSGGSRGDSCFSSSTSSSSSSSSSDVDQKPASGGYARDPNGCPAGAPTVNNAAEVLRCTSTAFRRVSSLMRTKTKSRLMDPPPVRPSTVCNADIPMMDARMSQQIREPTPGRSGILRSGVLRSGFLGKVTGQQTQQLMDDDEDDPFSGEDVPEGFHRQKLNMWTILEWLSLVIILGALGCSLYFRWLQKLTVWNLQLWKWEVLVLVLICGRLVSGWVIHLVVFFFERNFLLRKKVLYFVYGVRNAVQNCLWLGFVLLAWHYLFDKKVERETQSKTLPYVTKVLVCLLITNAFRFVKTLLVKVLASSFHVSTYFDRIQESLFNQYVIETLSGPPVIEVANAMEEEERVLAEVQNLQNAGATITPDLRAAMQPTTTKSGLLITGSRRIAASRPSMVGRKSVILTSGPVNRKDSSKQQEQDDGGITIDHLHRLNQKNVSAWNMKRLINIVRHGALSTLDERVTDASKQDESKLQILSEYEAKAAAKKIFNNVARPGTKHIYMVDLLRFMREDEALKTMSLFDGAQTMKRVGKSALKNWLVNAFRERRALSLTLNDTKTAVKKLHQMVNVVVFIIVFIIWLLILGIATSHVLVLMSSQLLLAVFVFGNTCKTTFEAIVFLFVMHPFDVGDRCEIDEIQMVVEEMNILTTIFLRYDGLKVTYPNSLLATKTISNFYRSPDMGESIDFCVHVSTPTEKINLMKEKIKGFIESKKEHWYPSPAVVLRDVEDMNRLKVSIWFQHRMNHQDMGERWFRREHVVAEMVRILRDLDIEYRMLPLEVNVRNMPAVGSSRLPSTWTICG